MWVARNRVAGLERVEGKFQRRWWWGLEG